MKKLALVWILTIGLMVSLCEGLALEGQITDVQSPTELIIGETPEILSNVSSEDLDDVEAFREELECWLLSKNVTYEVVGYDFWGVPIVNAVQLEGNISVNWLVEALMDSFTAQEEYFDEPPVCEESPGAMLVYDSNEMTVWIGIFGPEDEEQIKIMEEALE